MGCGCSKEAIRKEAAMIRFNDRKEKGLIPKDVPFEQFWEVYNQKSVVAKNTRQNAKSSTEISSAITVSNSMAKGSLQRTRSNSNIDISVAPKQPNTRTARDTASPLSPKRGASTTSVPFIGASPGAMEQASLGRDSRPQSAAHENSHGKTAASPVDDLGLSKVSGDGASLGRPASVADIQMQGSTRRKDLEEEAPRGHLLRKMLSKTDVAGGSNDGAEFKLDPQDESTIRASFQEVDEDGNGVIDRREWLLLMDALEGFFGYKPTARDMLELFQLVDANGDGVISYDEYSDALKGWSKDRPAFVFLDAEQRANIRKIFDEYQNDTGRIDFNGLRNIVLHSTLFKDQDTSERVFTLHSMGVHPFQTSLTWPNFLNLCGAHMLRPEQLQNLDLPSLYQIKGKPVAPEIDAGQGQIASADNILRMFHTFDKDGNGLLDIDEWQIMMRGMESFFGYQPSREEVADLYELMDDNGDGVVEYEEFKDAIVKWADKKPAFFFLPDDRRAFLRLVFDGFKHSDDSNAISVDGIAAALMEHGRDMLRAVPKRPFQQRKELPQHMKLSQATHADLQEIDPENSRDIGPAEVALLQSETKGADHPHDITVIDDPTRTVVHGVVLIDLLRVILLVSGAMQIDPESDAAAPVPQLSPRRSSLKSNLDSPLHGSPKVMPMLQRRRSSIERDIAARNGIVDAAQDLTEQSKNIDPIETGAEVASLPKKLVATSRRQSVTSDTSAEHNQNVAKSADNATVEEKDLQQRDVSQRNVTENSIKNHEQSKAGDERSSVENVAAWRTDEAFHHSIWQAASLAAPADGGEIVLTWSKFLESFAVVTLWLHHGWSLDGNMPSHSPRPSACTSRHLSNTLSQNVLLQ